MTEIQFSFGVVMLSCKVAASAKNQRYYIVVVVYLRRSSIPEENPIEAWKRLEEHFRLDSGARVCRKNAQEEIGAYAA
ncbi:hypothetical protein TNCV_2261141 [Trichonephila clavipes]|nr:hypothetical protein TNCV_2261141 [Trichonephila clavipes]